MKVLHVIPSVASAHGGPSRAIEICERACVAAGVSVTTATTDDDGPGRRLDASRRPTSANGATRIYAGKWLEFYKVSPGLMVWLWCNASRFDVIHIHALFSFPSVAAGVVAWLRGVPYVVRPLGTLSTYGVTKRRPLLKRLSLAAIERPLLHRTAAVHLTSEAERAEAKSLGMSLRSVVIPLAVDEGPCGDAAHIEREHPMIRGRKRILYLSRLDPKKNLEALLRAFAEIRTADGAVVLLVAGDGPADHVARLVALSRELGVDERVVWLGHVEGARKASVFAAAQVFVLPSHSENFGIAAAEALLAGLPCVLARGVAIASDVEEAGAGVAVAPTAKEIAKGLRRFLDDEELRRTSGDRGRAFALSRYSPQTMAVRLLELYAQIRPEAAEPGTQMRVRRTS